MYLVIPVSVVVVPWGKGTHIRQIFGSCRQLLIIVKIHSKCVCLYCLHFKIINMIFMAIKPPYLHLQKQSVTATAGDWFFILLRADTVLCCQLSCPCPSLCCLMLSMPTAHISELHVPAQGFSGQLSSHCTPHPFLPSTLAALLLLSHAGQGQAAVRVIWGEVVFPTEARRQGPD